MNLIFDFWPLAKLVKSEPTRKGSKAIINDDVSSSHKNLTIGFRLIYTVTVS